MKPSRPSSGSARCIGGEKSEDIRDSFQGIDGGGREYFHGHHSTGLTGSTRRARPSLWGERGKTGSQRRCPGGLPVGRGKVPNDPLAVDAQYQIGYIWSAAMRSGTYDPNAAAKSKTGFRIFSRAIPQRKIGAGAREPKEARDQADQHGLRIARFYDNKNNIARPPSIITMSAVSNPARARATGPRKGFRNCGQTRRRGAAAPRGDRGRTNKKSRKWRSARPPLRGRFAERRAPPAAGYRRVVTATRLAPARYHHRAPIIYD